MKLPGFLFYPGDWLKDPALRLCSAGARGVWIDLLCFLFECEDRGYGKVHGKPIAKSELCHALGIPKSDESYLEELISRGVLKQETETGAYYSARMVADEQIRNARQKAGKRGAKRRWQTDGKPHGKRIAKSWQNTENENENENTSFTKDNVRQSQNGKPRKPDPIWDAVVAEWGLPVATAAQRTRIGRVVRELKGAGALVADGGLELHRRRAAIATAWGPEKATPECIAKHWSHVPAFGGPMVTIVSGGAMVNVPGKKASEAYLAEVREHEAKVQAERQARRAASQPAAKENA